jgi:molybdate transport system regulatory protein
MRLSIRNQLSGVVEAITRGEVMANIRVRLAGGQDITSAITLDAVDDLGLTPGQEVTVLVKSTDVAVANGPVSGVSIRNRLSGAVDAIDNGAVMTTVKAVIAGGDTLTAAITKDAAEDLQLSAGDAVTLLVKSTEVSLAIGA